MHATDDPSRDDDPLESDQDSTDETDLVPCPFCDEYVAEMAELCPYCKNYIFREDEERLQKRKSWILLGLVLAVVAVLTMVLR